MESEHDERAARIQRAAILLRKLAAIGFGAAMVIAPFLALLYNRAAGLAVMAAGLAATAWLLWDGARNNDLDPRRRRLAHLLAGLNALLALACAAAIVVVRPV